MLLSGRFLRSYSTISVSKKQSFFHPIREQTVKSAPHRGALDNAAHICYNKKNIFAGYKMSQLAKISAVVMIIDCAIGGIVSFLASFSFWMIDGLTAFLLLVGATLAFSLMALVYALAFGMPDDIERLSKNIATLKRDIDNLKKQQKNATDLKSEKEIQIAIASTAPKRTRKESKLVESAWKCPECGSINLASQTTCFSCGKPCSTQKETAAPSEAEKYWTCAKCGKSNLASRDACWACGGKKK